MQLDDSRPKPQPNSQSNPTAEDASVAVMLRLAEHMIVEGESQYNIAGLLGFSQPTLSRWMSCSLSAHKEREVTRLVNLYLNDNATDITYSTETTRSNTEEPALLPCHSVATFEQETEGLELSALLHELQPSEPKLGGEVTWSEMRAAMSLPAPSTWSRRGTVACTARLPTENPQGAHSTAAGADPLDAQECGEQQAIAKPMVVNEIPDLGPRSTLVNGVRALIRYQGPIKEIWMDPTVQDAIVPIMKLFGVTNVYRPGIVTAGTAVAHRLWYGSINKAVTALGGSRRSVGTNASSLTRILTHLGARAGVSPEFVMQELVNEANGVSTDDSQACDNEVSKDDLTSLEALIGGWD